MFKEFDEGIERQRLAEKKLSWVQKNHILVEEERKASEESRRSEETKAELERMQKKILERDEKIEYLRRVIEGQTLRANVGSAPPNVEYGTPARNSRGPSNTPPTMIRGSPVDRGNCLLYNLYIHIRSDNTLLFLPFN
jgi:hypothetical protein